MSVHVLAQKNLYVVAIIGSVAAVAIAAFVLVFFMQGAKLAVSPVAEQDGSSSAAGNVTNTSTNTSSTFTGFKTAAVATSLECHDDSSSGTTVVVSAKLADQSSGRGIPGKQMIFTILPGNPVGILPTDESGQASMSLDLSKFSKEKPAVFVFFDGDEEYEFSSCRIDVVAPQVSAGELAATNS